VLVASRVCSLMLFVPHVRWRQQLALLGDRPDRRHKELRARRAGLGDAYLPGRGRHARGRGGLGAGVGATLVGLGGRWSVRRPAGRLSGAIAVSHVERLEDASFCYSGARAEA
jgi:hypothetical protein